jgi:hypothetical protein
MTTLSPQQLDSLVDNVLSSALERFAADADEAALEKMTVWLGEHEQDEELFAEVIQQFPRFGDVLVEEIERATAA